MVGADSVAIQLLDAADGAGASSNYSGLEFGDTGDNELTLLQGCSDGQILKWNDSSNVWYCSTDQGSGSGSSKWTETTNLLYPNTATVDVLFGGSSTSSAKFAFTGVNLGVPTASIAGTTGATYLTGDGNLATTLNKNLTIGGTTTGTVILDSGTGGITLSDATTLSSVAGGSTNTVLTLGGTNVIESRSIDSRVWGSTLTDASGTPTNGQAVYWSDANTLAAENYLSTTRGGTGLDASTAGNGMLLIGNGSGLSLGYITGGIGITVASTSGNITLSHADVSSQGTVDNSGTTVIQDVTMDTLGHVTGLSSVDLSSSFDNYQSWSAADDDADTYAIVSSNILRFTSSDSNVLTNLTNGDDSDENMDFSVRLLGDLVSGSGLTGGADNILVGADTDITLSIGAGNGIVVGADSVAIQLLDAADGAGASSNYSGLEFGDTGDNELTLLQGCSDGQILKWNDSSNVWYCSTDQGSGSGSSKWTETTNLLYPNTATVDVLFGGSSTSSAKFAFTGVNLGVPTASIAGTTGATYLTGDGNLATTLNKNLTIGGTTTGTVILDSGTGGITLSDLTTATAGLTVTAGQNFTINSDVFTDLTGNGLAVSSNALTVNLLTSADGTGSTSNNSGLEFQGTSNNALALLQGCSDGQILKWNISTSVWYCANDQGAGSGSSKWTETTNLLYPNTATVDVLFGGSSTASAKFAFTGVNLGVPTASISGTTGATYLTGDGTLATTLNKTLTLGGSTTGNISVPFENWDGMTISSDLTSGNRSADILTITQADSGSFNSTGNLLQLTNTDTGSTTALLAIDQVAMGTSVLLKPMQSTGVGIDFGSGGLSGITTGFTGDYVRITPGTTTYTISATETGNYLDISRERQISAPMETLDITGDVAQISSNCGSTAGTCSDSSNILSLSQNYSVATGAVLDLTNAGSGEGIKLTSARNGVLLNLDTTGAFTTTDGISIEATNGSGVITDALDVSDPEIVNAINIGANLIEGTNFDVATTGNITIQTGYGLDTNAGSGTLNLGSTNATAVNIGNSTAATTITIDKGASGEIILSDYTNAGAGCSALETDASGHLNCGTDDSGGVANYWQLSSDNKALAPYNTTLDILVGDNATASANARIASTGQIFVTPTAPLTTAIDLTDSDLTNAISLADNNITGTDWAIVNTSDVAEGLTFTLAGGVGFDITGAATQDFRVTNTGGSIQLNSSEAVADAIVLNSSNAAGGIDANFGTGDFDIDGAGAGSDFDVQTAGMISLDATGTSSNFTVTGSGLNLSLQAVGGGAQQLILSSEGTGANALTLTTTAGGIDITSSGAAAGEDIDISSNASVNLTSTEGVADGIVLTSTNGGMDFTSTGAAAGEDFDFTSSASINLTGQEAAADAIVLNSSNAAGGIQANFGTGDFDINGSGVGSDFLVDVAGVFSLDSTGGASNVTATGGNLTLSTVTTGNVIINAAQALDINTAGMVTLDNSGAGNDITVTSVDDITLAPADTSSLFFTNYNNCTYLTTGASGQVGCSSTVLPTASDILWTTSADNKAIVEKNSTLDVLLGSNATSSAKIAFLNMAGGVPTASIAGQTTGATYLTGDGNLATTLNKTLTLGGSTTGNISVPFENWDGMTITSDLTGGNRTTDVLTISQANSAGNSSSGSLLKLSNSDNDSNSMSILYLNQSASGGTGIYMNQGISSGKYIDMYANNISSGNAIYITSQGASSFSAFTGDYININSIRNHTNSGTTTDTGNYIDLSRQDVMNNASGTLNITGDLVTFSSSVSSSQGGITDSSNILQLTQSFGTATGAVLDITNSGLGTGINLSSNSGGQAALIVNKLAGSSGDILTASASGTTQLALTNTGLLKVASAGGLDNLAASGTLNLGSTNATAVNIGNSTAATTITIDKGASGEIILSDYTNGGSGCSALETDASGHLNCGVDDSGGVANYWQLSADNKALAPYNTTLDVLVGSNATASANARIATNGQIFVTPTAPLTTAIDLTDSDLTNAISLADNNITGTDWAIVNTSDVAEGLTFTLAGGVGFDITGAATQDFRVTNTGGSIQLNSSEAVADAIVLNSSNAAGGIDANFGTGDFDIDGAGAGSDFDVQTAGMISLDATGTSSNFTVTGSGLNLSLQAVGGGAQQLILSSEGTGANALTLTTTAGGIDITSSGAAAGEDIDISSNASVNLTSTEGVADGIVLTSTNGGMDFTSTGAAAGEDFDFTSSASINLTGQEAAADAIVLNSSNAAGGIQANFGTGDFDINGSGVGSDFLVDVAGVFSLDSTGGASNVTATGGNLTLSTVTTGNVIINAAQALDINTAGMVTLDNSGAGNDITVTSVDDITLAPADTSSLFFTNYNNCTYLTTGASGQVGCSSTVLPTASDILWKASSDNKAIIEKNETMDVLIGSNATSSAEFAFTGLAGASPKMLFSNDTELYRSAASTLSLGSDDNLIVPGGTITGANSEALRVGVTNDTIEVVRGGSTYTVCDTSGNCSGGSGGSKWQLSADSKAIAPFNTTLDVLFGSNATASANARIATNGQIFVTPTAPLTTAIDLTDSDLTNAISLADNNITGTDWAIVNTSDVAEGLTFTLAGGVGFDITGAATQDFRVTNTGGSIQLNSSEAVADAIVLNSSNAAGGIDANFGTGDFDIDGSGAGSDFDVQTAGMISLDATGTSSNFTVTGSGLNLSLQAVGGGAQQLILSSEGTGANALTLTTTAGGIDITSSGAAAGEDIDISSNASVNLTSTEGVADGIVLTSTNGGMDFTSTGAAAGEDFDFTSSASVNLTGQEAAIDAVVIQSTTDASGVRINAGDNLTAVAANGNDIEFRAEDDYLFTAAAGSELDFTVAASTVTTGVIDLNVDTSVAGGASVINNALTVNNGATTGNDFYANDITLTMNDADANAFGLRIVGSATANAAANAYEAGIVIDNQENTAGSMADAIRVLATTDTAITNGLNVSDPEIVNALNIGANLIEGTNFDVATTGNITIQTGYGLDTNAGSGTLNLGSTNATAVNIGNSTAATTITIDKGASGEIVLSDYTNGGSGCSALETDASGHLNCGVDDSGGVANYWQLSSDNKALAPYNTTLDLLVGSNASASSKFRIAADTGYLYLNNTQVLSTKGSGNLIIGNGGVNAGISDNINLAVGKDSLLSLNNSGAIQNTAIGGYTLQQLTSGDYNVALGDGALGLLTSGSNNTAVGRQALNYSNGSNNVAIGYGAAGNEDATYENSILIGYMAGTGYPSGANNTLVIENSSSANPLIYGQFDTDLVKLNARAVIDTTNATNMTNAALIVNQDESGVDILSASASGATKFTVNNSGNLVFEGATSNGITSTFAITDPTSTSKTITFRDASGTVAYLTDIVAGSNYWQLGTEGLAPYNLTLDTYFGGTATASAKARIAGLETVGGNILDINSNTITTGSVFDLTNTSLTTGQLLNVQSTSTALTTGNLGLFDWSPTSWATSSGDLVKINIGQYADTTGNLFAVYDNGTELFSIDTAKITSDIPHEFTSAGDVSMAYDLNFTNQTSSQIESNGPFSIVVGESSESNNLTLKTYGTGDFVFNNDGSDIALLSDEGKMVLGASTPVGMLTVDNSNTAALNKALTVLVQDENQNIITASSSSMTVFNLTSNGFLNVLSGSGLDTLASGGTLNIATGSATAVNIGNSTAATTITIDKGASGEIILSDYTNGGSGCSALETDASGHLNCGVDDSGGVANYWQLSADNKALAPYNTTLDVLVGSNATASANARIATNGQIFVTPTAPLTTAIDLTDSDLTNAISLADNNITGTDWAIVNTSDVAEGLTFTLAGGVGFDITGAATQDFRVTNTGGSIQLNSSEAVADAIVLNSSNAAGGIDANFGTGDFDIDGAGAGSDFDVQTAGMISLDATGTSSNFTVTGSGLNLSLQAVGGGAQQLILSSEGTGANALTLTTTAGGIDITSSGAAAGEDIDISSNASVNLTSTEGVADGIVLTSTNGGMDFTSTGAAAGEDFDFTSSASVNLTGQEAAIDAVVIQSTTDASGVRINAGDNLTAVAANGNDIEFRAEDDYLFTAAAGSELDFTVAASTVTTGVIDLNVDTSVAGGASVINNALTVNNGATTGNDFYANDITLTMNDADANAFGLRIVGSATANAAANAYEAGIVIDNQENTAGSMADAIRVLATTDTAITNGLNVSDPEIVNALNIGANLIEGTNFDVATTGNITIQTGYGLDTNAGSGTLNLGSTNATAVNIGNSTAATTITIDKGASGEIVLSDYTNGGSGCSALETDASGHLNCGVDDSGGVANYWQLSSDNKALAPYNTTLDLLVGSNASASSKFRIAADTGYLYLNNTQVLSTKGGNDNLYFGNGGANAGTNDISNISVGKTTLSGLNNSGGTDNIAIGNSTLSNLTSGDHNIALGGSVLGSLISGNNNISIGFNSLAYQTGSNNIAIGLSAGAAEDGIINDSILIGYQAGWSISGTTSNVLFIENSGSNNPLIYGQFDTDLVKLNARAVIDTTNATNMANAALIVNQDESGVDILTASASGSTKFTVNNSGNLVFEGATTNGITSTFAITDPTSSSKTITFRDASGTVAYLTDIVAGSNYWQLGTQGLAPYNLTLDTYFGGTATSSAKARIAGLETAEGNILDINSSVITSGSVFDLSNTSLIDGKLLNVQSTSTALTSGNLGLFDWSPTSWATSSGDLVKINIGQYADTTGNLFAVYDNGTELFSIDTAKITSDIPHEFTSAGDVSMAYDLVFTNQTSSGIQTKAPFTLEVGDNYESNNLTLSTYNSGNILLNTGSTAGKVGIGGSITPTGLLTVDNTGTNAYNKALAVFVQDENQNIITASSSAMTVFNLTSNGFLNVLSGSGLDTLASGGTLNIATGSATAVNIGNSTSATNITLDWGNTGNLILRKNGAALNCSGFANGGALTTDASGYVTCSADDGGTGATNYWTEANKGLSPYNPTLDLYVGGTATGTATFSANALTGSVNITNNSLGANGLNLTSFTGVRTASAIKITENNTSGLLASFDWDSSQTRGGFMDIDTTGAFTNENLIDITTGAQIWTSNLIDINVGAAASTGDVMNVDMGSNLAGGAYVISAAGGVRTDALIDITTANTAAADAASIIQITSTGALGAATNIIDLDIQGAINADTNGLEIGFSNGAVTGTGVEITTGTNIGGSGIELVGTGVRTGNQIDITTDETGAGDILDINVNGIKAAGGDVMDVTYLDATNIVADILNFTLNDALGAGALVVTNADGARTDAILDITSASTGDTTDASALVQINSSGALQAGSNALDINLSAGGASNAFDITYSGTAATGNAIDLNLGTNVAGDALNIATPATSGNAIDITSSGIFSNELIDINVGAQAATGDVINIAMGATAVNAQALVIANSTSTRTASMIQVDDNNNTGTVPTFDLNIASTRGGLFDIDATGALATDNLIDITQTAAMTSNMLDLNITSVSATGTVLDIANSGLGIGINLSSNSGGRAAMIINKSVVSGDIMTASSSGTRVMSLDTTGNLTLFSNAGATADLFKLAPPTGTGTQYTGTLTTDNLTAARTWTLPNTSGTIATQSAAFERAKYDRIVDCKGGGTDTSIATAITNAPTGGSIFIAPCTYNLASNLTINKALKVYGAGVGAVTINGVTGSPTINLTADDIQLHDFKVTNTGSANTDDVIALGTGSNARQVIENLEISGGYVGINYNGGGADFAYIGNNYIHNVADKGIGIPASSTTIIGNRLTNIGSSGIDIGSYGNNIVANNVIYDWGNSSANFAIVTGGEHIIISGNTLDGNDASWDGITIGANGNDISITGNIITHVTNDALESASSATYRVTVTGNTITNNGGYGINLQDAAQNWYIANNTFYNNTNGSIGNNTATGTIVEYNNSGTFDLTTNITNTNAFDLSFDSLTSGVGLNIQSTSTALTTGNLGLFDWSPTTWATASGDLVKINLGQFGDITGNLFAIYDNGSELFSVDTAKITSALPHEFTAAGDVSMAYDLNFTNQTASRIDTLGPFTLAAGETFESNNLTLKTYNAGNVVFDTSPTGSVIVGASGSANLKFNVHDVKISTASAMIENADTGTNADGLAIKLGFTGNGNTGNRYVAFLNGLGVIQGSLQSTGTGGVQLISGASGDFAEYYAKTLGSSFENGDLVIMTSSGANKPNKEYDNQILGVVATAPIVVAGTPGPNNVLVALVGQVPLKVSSVNGNISVGDPLTSSSIPGVAMKSTKAGQIVAKALENYSASDPNQTGIITASLNVTWFDPDLAFDVNGDVKLASDALNPGYMMLTDVNGNSVSKLSTIDLLAQNLKLAVGEITDTLTALQIKAQSIFTGRLEVKNSLDQTVASIDETGKLTANSVETTNATVSGDLKAGKIYADEIIADAATFTDAAVSNLMGISRDEIEALLKSAEVNTDLISQTQSWIQTATGSAQFADIAVENLFVTGTAAFDNLSVASAVTIGNDLVISSINGVNSIDTLNTPLSLQSSGTQPLYLMAGLVKIDTNGDVEITGNLKVAGQVESKGLTLKGDTTANNILSVKDSLGAEVAGITASGSAQFTDLLAGKIALEDDLSATSSATPTEAILETSATAGKAIVPAGYAEVTIKNPKVSEDSLIFITPKTNIGNFNLYLKSQTNGQVVIGFDSTTEVDTEFNWWIIGVLANNQ